MGQGLEISQVKTPWGLTSDLSQGFYRSVFEGGVVLI